MNQTRTRVTQETPAKLSKEAVLQQVSEALDVIEFGEIVIKVQGGKPVFVDMYKRVRVG